MILPLTVIEPFEPIGFPTKAISFAERYDRVAKGLREYKDHAETFAVSAQVIGREVAHVALNNGALPGLGIKVSEGDNYIAVSCYFRVIPEQTRDRKFSMLILKNARPRNRRENVPVKIQKLELK